MTLEEINSRIQILNKELIDPNSYPDMINGDGVRGIIVSKQGYPTMSPSDFANTIFKLSTNNKSDCITVAEDFERIYKATGVRERVNFKSKVDWVDFSDLYLKNSVISSYVFDEYGNWCAWISDNYFVITFKSELSHIISSEYSFENSVQNFKEADQDFIRFMRNLYNLPE